MFLHPAIILFDFVSIIALQSSRESYWGLFVFTTMDSSEKHPRKHSMPKLVTEAGISIEVRAEQPMKHCFPKLVTDVGISIDVRCC